MSPAERQAGWSRRPFLPQGPSSSIWGTFAAGRTRARPGREVDEFLEKVEFGEAVETGGRTAGAKGHGSRRPQGFLEGEGWLGRMGNGKGSADSTQGPESGSRGEPLKMWNPCEASLNRAPGT